MDKNINKIAVWNTAFLGDAVLTLPLLKTLKEAYPQAEIDFYVRAGLKTLFEPISYISNVFEYQKSKHSRNLSSVLRFGKELKNSKYDLWISAHRSLRSALLAKLSATPMRLGYKSNFINNFFYTQTVDRQFDKMQEIERLLELAKALHIKKIFDWPEIEFSKEALLKADEFFNKNINSPVLGLHPGSVWGTKRWPVEYFAQVAIEAVKGGAQVVIFAGKGEEKIAEAVELQTKAALNDFYKADTALIDTKVFNLGLQLSLATLAAFLSRLTCYVSNDSGPLHLAWASHTPVVALFGPTVRGLGFAPRGEKSVLLEVKNLKCRPCGLHGPQTCPKGHHLCMRNLSVNEVWEHVKVYLFDLP